VHWCFSQCTPFNPFSLFATLVNICYTVKLQKTQSHRHLGFDIYLITQSFSFLDKQIRELVEIEVKHRKVANLVWWFPITVFIHREEWCKIESKDNKISNGIMFGLPHIFKIYDSYTIFNEIAERYTHLKTENWRELLPGYKPTEPTEKIETNV